jgi:hypothetical protein
LKAVGVIAGLICAGAGVYLLQWESAGSEANWFEAVAHGMGIYFIGKGIFVAVDEPDFRQTVLEYYAGKLYDRLRRPDNQLGLAPAPA